MLCYNRFHGMLCILLPWIQLNFLSGLQIPNPLFDLAGITCGHFLVPFWTFFGATLIGKAVFKMLLQVRGHKEDYTSPPPPPW